MNEEFCYALFKRNVYDSRYYFVHRNELPPGGFSSLYFITEVQKEELIKTGIKGFRGEIWSPWIWIDEDTEQGALQTERRLIELNVQYDVYTTGNRGRHFCIHRESAPSKWLPYTDKYWVKTISNTADLSIYTGLHLFRLDGTVHEKTGQHKKLLYSVSGDILKLPIVEPPTYVEQEEDNEDVVSSLFINQTIMSLTTAAGEGGRNKRLVDLAVALKNNGENEAFISRWLYHTNLLFNPPCLQEELDKIVDWVRAIV
jgi:hypothetical protein